MDSRFSEEEIAEYNSICELLLSAGYFRVVGGMAYFLSQSNVDVEFDVSFKENPNIQEKIKISENIITAMKACRCKFTPEPVHIQGLNFKKLKPAIQWLVNQSFEYRESTERLFRRMAVSNYNSNIKLPSVSKESDKQNAITDFFTKVKSNVGLPQRLYKQKKRSQKGEEEVRVQRTLLEYGGGTGKTGTDDDNQEQRGRYSQLGKGASTVRANILAPILGLGIDKIRKANLNYLEKTQSLQSEQLKKDKENRRQKIENLQRQIDIMKDQTNALLEKADDLKQQNIIADEQNKSAENELNELKLKLKELNGVIDEYPHEQVSTLRTLIEANDQLKENEKAFKESIKEQLAYWKQKVNEAAEDFDEETVNRTKSLAVELERDSKKLEKMNALMSKKNKELAYLQRTVDNVATRPELLQYQMRFTELFVMIGLYFDELKKQFTTYNALDARKTLLDKETTTLQSILEAFPQTVKQKDAQKRIAEETARIAEQTSKTVRVRTKKLETEKGKLHQLTAEYNALVEMKQNYLALAKQLQEAMEKNEELQQRYDQGDFEEEIEEEQEEEDELNQSSNEDQKDKIQKDNVQQIQQSQDDQKKKNEKDEELDEVEEQGEEDEEDEGDEGDEGEGDEEEGEEEEAETDET
ncbi:MAG: hypothetical protein EZS28_017299 [Streblomastix strix]|uniref:Uncharacterized protein n=1 Tax=Streblomastix strix TaxID=222440 RepID=A0A5J4VY99_9EUKA|nr:MAG: hypothetical protein EZS28_017299 [Streblomastix strix]